MRANLAPAVAIRDLRFHYPGAAAATPPRRRRGTAMRAWVGLAVAISLVLSQSLWLLHRTVHAPANPKGDRGQVVAKDTVGPTSQAGRFAAALVPKHDYAHHCDAFDQLALGSGLVGEVTTTICASAVLRQDSILRPVDLASTESSHDFQARAPPGTRVVEPQGG
jgi:hypothetical protein